MLLKGAYCVGEHFVDPHGCILFLATNTSILKISYKYALVFFLNCHFAIQDTLQVCEC